MAEDFSYGFYDSVNGDRRYSSIDFSKIFNGIIRDGVFATEGSMMAVVAVNDQSNPMNIGVEPGRAWFNGTWTNIVTRQVLTVQTAPPTASRIDTVVLEINQTTSVRANSLKIIKGATAGSPVPRTLPANEDGTAISDPDIHQYPLAYVRVAAGTTAITDSMIENAVLAHGTTQTPSGYPCTNYVTGLLQASDISAFFNTWNGQFQNWEATQQAQFISWFNNVVSIVQEPLSGEIVNQVALMKSCTQITLLKDSAWQWVELPVGAWAQEVSISQMTSNDSPIIELYLEGTRVEDWEAMHEYDQYFIFTTETNAIKCRYYSGGPSNPPPSIDMKYLVKGR